jgi:hypothetical protein
MFFCNRESNQIGYVFFSNQTNTSYLTANKVKVKVQVLKNLKTKKFWPNLDNPNTSYGFVLAICGSQKQFLSHVGLRCQSGLRVSKLDSRLKGCRFESCLIQYTRWKWGQSHARIDSCTQLW